MVQDCRKGYGTHRIWYRTVEKGMELIEYGTDLVEEAARKVR